MKEHPSIAKNAILLVACICLIGCAGRQTVIDTQSISDPANYQKDVSACTAIARQFSRAGATTGATILGALLLGGVVAGVAAASYGDVYEEATPYIGGGILIGGLLGGTLSSASTTRSQNKIYADCLKDRGYKSYSPN